MPKVMLLLALNSPSAYRVALQKALLPSGYCNLLLEGAEFDIDRQLVRVVEDSGIGESFCPNVC